MGEKSIKRCIYMYSMLDVCEESHAWNVAIDQSHHHSHTSAANLFGAKVVLNLYAGL